MTLQSRISLKVVSFLYLFLYLLHHGWLGVRHRRISILSVCLGKVYRSIDEMLLMSGVYDYSFFAFGLFSSLGVSHRILRILFGW